MTIIEKTVFETSDGQQHATRADAEKHQAVLDLAEQLEDGIDLRYAECTSYEEVAAWILERFDRKP